VDARLLKTDQSNVHFQDLEVASQPIYQRARVGIGYRTQEPSVFRKLTVEQNIMAIL